MSLRRMLRRAMPNRVMVDRLSRPSAGFALTFDDGPHPEYTPKILELLKTHDQRATFFLIGKNVEKYPDLVAALVDGGHELGNHSYSHPDLRRVGRQEMEQQIYRTDELLAKFDGHSTHHFRAPWGEVNLALLLRGFSRRSPVIHWSIDSTDYSASEPEPIMQRFADNPARNGDIALFHDDNAATYEALKRLLPQWQQQGLRLVTLSNACGRPGK